MIALAQRPCASRCFRPSPSSETHRASGRVYRSRQRRALRERLWRATAHLIQDFDAPRTFLTRARSRVPNPDAAQHLAAQYGMRRFQTFVVRLDRPASRRQMKRIENVPLQTLDRQLCTPRSPLWTIACSAKSAEKNSREAGDEKEEIFALKISSRKAPRPHLDLSRNIWFRSRKLRRDARCWDVCN